MNHDNTDTPLTALRLGYSICPALLNCCNKHCKHLIKHLITFCIVGILGTHTAQATPLHLGNKPVTYTDNLVHSLIPHAMMLGLITTASTFASQSPRGMGSLTMVLAPLFGLRRYSSAGTFSGLSATASLGAIGWYNINELSKSKYSKNRVFEKNMAIMGSLYALWFSYNESQYLFNGHERRHVRNKMNNNYKKPDNTHQSFVSLHPDAKGFSWHYHYTF